MAAICDPNFTWSRSHLTPPYKSLAKISSHLQIHPMTSNSSTKAVPSNLIAFPSVSSSLHSLPQATSIHNVALHPNMYAQRESEDKVSLIKSTLFLILQHTILQLRIALANSKTPSSCTPLLQTTYRAPVSPPHPFPFLSFTHCLLSRPQHHPKMDQHHWWCVQYVAILFPCQFSHSMPLFIEIKILHIKSCLSLGSYVFSGFDFSWNTLHTLYTHTHIPHRRRR